MSCEGNISVEECYKVLDTFQNNKTLGTTKFLLNFIEKKGKDRSLLENWRPISLVNVDTKIMSKVTATRIKKVLPHIIHHNQSGYVEDRYIGKTVRSIFDIMDFTVKENIPGLLIFVDF